MIWWYAALLELLESRPPAGSESEHGPPFTCQSPRSAQMSEAIQVGNLEKQSKGEPRHVLVDLVTLSSLLYTTLSHKPSNHLLSPPFHFFPISDLSRQHSLLLETPGLHSDPSIEPAAMSLKNGMRSRTAEDSRSITDFTRCIPFFDWLRCHQCRPQRFRG